MENIYNLTGRFAELSDYYESQQALLEDLYEANGGEVTEETEEAQVILDNIKTLQDEVMGDIIANSDAYAEIALNKAAQRKVVEAELKATKEEQKKVNDRIQAKINRLQRSEEFWKDNFDKALRIASMDKIGGAKTGLRHSIYYQKSASVETNEDVLFAPYKAMIDSINAELPSWMKVSISVDKTALKKEETLPAGAAINQKQTIVIR